MGGKLNTYWNDKDSNVLPSRRGLQELLADKMEAQK